MVANVSFIGIFTNAMFTAIQLLWIIALPPLAHAVVKCETTVVRHAGQRAGAVAQVRDLKPPPIAGGVNGDAEAKFLFARGSGPFANNITARPDVLGIPRVVFGIPSVESVMMIGQSEEEFSAGFFCNAQLKPAAPNCFIQFTAAADRRRLDKSPLHSSSPRPAN